MAEHSFNTPLRDEDILQLKAGDVVRLTGTIYTARAEIPIEKLEGLSASQFVWDRLHAGSESGKKKDQESGQPALKA